MGWVASRFVNRRRRTRTVGMATAVLVLLLGVMASAIALSQNESKKRLISTFGLRAQSSATFISTFLVQQAAHERRVAGEMLSGARVPNDRFRVVVDAFGSSAAVLLDSSGRLLDVFPSAPQLLGRQLADRYAHLSAAERGRVAVSNVVPSAVRGQPVTAIAVPFPTPQGRRVFSAAYGVAGSALGAFVNHTVPYREHQVFLLDGDDRVLAASPATTATTLSQAAPRLARAFSSGAKQGNVGGAPVPTTFTTAPVAGTTWRLLLAVPNSRLYASIGGWASRVPWIVFALVGVFGISLVALFARTLLDHARLAALSATLEETARTDPLTELHNRRALAEGLHRAALHARRSEEPFSVLMIDLDHFKEINDRFGHDAGDHVLCALADCIRSTCRGNDIYGRWGGDEFLVALSGCDEQKAELVAQRLRTAAGRVDLNDLGMEGGVPLSIGSATGIYVTPDDLISQADAALYRVKSVRREDAEEREMGATAG
jgi:diguanylate cyclase (GGDEF)-like protein